MTTSSSQQKLRIKGGASYRMRISSHQRKAMIKVMTSELCMSYEYAATQIFRLIAGQTVDSETVRAASICGMRIPNTAQVRWFTFYGDSIHNS